MATILPQKPTEDSMRFGLAKMESDSPTEALVVMQMET